MKRYILGCLFLSVTFNLSSQQNSQNDSIIKKEIETITIIGENKGIIEHLPGSAKHISAKDIARIIPLNGNEVFRRVPGVVVTDEEGMGLRLNIGIRGLDPDRSRGVLVLEDGIPVSINPYGENELYYTPVIDRMESVEVLKGSGQILYGPQTIGGIINYVTAAPPEKPSVKVRFMGGQGLFMNGFISAGTSFKSGGFTVSYLRKQGDAIGPTWFRLNDVTSKLYVKISPKATITAKIGYYDEYSNSTYVGLTQPMYDAAGNDYTQLAPDDRLFVQRLLASVKMDMNINSKYKMNTTVFGYTVTRNWQRQDFTLTPTNNSDHIWGDTTIPSGALYMLNTNTHRDRRFFVAGIDQRFSMHHQLGKSMTNKMETGLRLIIEKADEELLKGSTPSALSGDMQNDEIRNGYGLSAFVQDKLFITSNLNITAGVRGEWYWFNRSIIRQNYTDTNLFNHSFTGQIIPGIGINCNWKKIAHFFAGMHRGFAPPRIKDAISNTGEVYPLDAENSWNYEVGVRIQMKDYLSAELTAYYLDFSNQVIPVSQSSGGIGSGYINSGASRHIGIEAGFTFDLAKALEIEKYSILFDAAFTFNDARFTSDRIINSINVNGNILPYAPTITLNTAFTFESPWGLGLRITGNYIGKQFTDYLNTLSPSADGRSGVLSDYFLLDGSVYYNFPKYYTTLKLSVKNFTNERYIVSRRPQGIKVGLPMFITGGFEFSF
jgi:Fe(3+) dicitrate transport protein